MVSMNGGNGVFSYSKNSDYQREVLRSVKELIHEAIVDKLDVKTMSSLSTTFHIADLGCSVGPNTFFAMNDVLEAFEKKCQLQGVTFSDLEFQVFFNDNVSNDFNTLFASIPPNSRYHTAGVPGSFYDRLFPNKSLHFIHSNFAIHWFSKLPQQLLDEKAPAWNKGKIHYGNASQDVADAYAEQFSKDIDTFLNVRYNEMVAGGHMVLTLLGLPDDVHRSETMFHMVLNYFGVILMDMVNLGKIREDLVDSFNFPTYAPHVKEMADAIERNGHFNIVKIKTTKPSEDYISSRKVEEVVMHCRAVTEGVFTEHFGHQVINEMFDMALQKASKSMELRGCLEKMYSLHVVLTRK